MQIALRWVDPLVVCYAFARLYRIDHPELVPIVLYVRLSVCL